MQKQARPERMTSTPRFRASPAVALLAALVGLVCVIFLTGYLTIQLQLSDAGAPLLGFDAQPVVSAGRSAPYLVRAAFVLLAAAAVLGYRLAVRTDAARLVSLVVLASAVVAGTLAYRPLADAVASVGAPRDLGLASLISGATSPFTLALIGAVVADLLSRHRRRSGAMLDT